MDFEKFVTLITKLLQNYYFLMERLHLLTPWIECTHL